MAAAPRVNHLRSGDTEALGDLGGSDELVHVELPSHVPDVRGAPVRLKGGYDHIQYTPDYDRTQASQLGECETGAQYDGKQEGADRMTDDDSAGDETLDTTADAATVADDQPPKRRLPSSLETRQSRVIALVALLVVVGLVVWNGILTVRLSDASHQAATTSRTLHALVGNAGRTGRDLESRVTDLETALGDAGTNSQDIGNRLDSLETDLGALKSCVVEFQHAVDQQVRYPFCG